MDGKVGRGPSQLIDARMRSRVIGEGEMLTPIRTLIRLVGPEVEVERG
ncbi:MAG: hypothetical protein WB507_09625 [Solirubrobacterales bacterium]